MTSASAYALAGQLRPEELVERYAPLVKKIGNHLLGRLPDGVELEDLVQTGLIALLDAAGQYSPAKGASFETYASIRVTMKDHLPTSALPNAEPEDFPHVSRNKTLLTADPQWNEYRSICDDVTEDMRHLKRHPILGKIRRLGQRLGLVNNDEY